MLKDELDETVGSLSDFEKFYKTSSSHSIKPWLPVSDAEADGDIIHQPLYLGPNGLPHV